MFALATLLLAGCLDDEQYESKYYELKEDGSRVKTKRRYNDKFYDRQGANTASAFYPASIFNL